jgi:hypothetical protein
MKTKSQELITKAKELLNAIRMRRELEKKETELKDFFKSKNTDGFIDADGVLLTFTNKTRTGLDRKALEAKFGKDVIAQFETSTEYTQVDVKEAI